MNRKPSPAARRLRDTINAAGITDHTQWGPQQISLTQADKNLDAAQDWDNGRITLAELCEQTGWTAPSC